MVKTYGLVSNGKQVPDVRRQSKFTTLKSDKFCPTLSKFATGHVQSKLGDPTLSQSNRTPCNPDLDVFNAGQGQAVVLLHHALGAPVRRPDHRRHGAVPGHRQRSRASTRS